MKQINIIRLGRCRAALHAYFHRKVLYVSPRAVIEPFGLAPRRDSYSGYFSLEDAVFVRHAAFKDTPEVVEKNKVRSNRYTYLRMEITTQTRSADEDKSAAAKRLEIVLKPYKLSVHKSYVEDTEMIYNLLQDLALADNAADIATLVLTETVSQLSAANNAFDDIFMLRAGEKRTRQESQKLATLRPPVDENYYAYAADINAIYRANALGAKDATIESVLGGIIDAINNIILEVKQRMGISGGSDNKPQPDGPSGPSTDPDRPEGPEPNVPEEGDNGNGGSGESGGNSGGSGNGGADKPPNPEERLAKIEAKLAEEVAELNKLYETDDELNAQAKAALQSRADAKVINDIHEKRLALQKELAEKMEAHEITLAEYKAALEAKKKWDEEHGGDKK